MVRVLFAAGLALAAGTQSALPLKPGYAQTRSFPSKHATQAAAADGDRVYAVSNRTVAVHDRKTGEMVAESEGPGEHLNSAFVKAGKVYCAHSNYPNKPDTSDIRVYDPATNKLSVFKEFPNPPGSLVWAVDDGTNWWCCFAHYGADNAKTVLIRFTHDFAEQRRWLFPQVVIADFDAMSASGGVWDGDTLLVSHHHYNVLYRLRVPAAGKTLELVEALDGPFPGQGIAADPATGGLVGIDRTKRTVVFAERKK